MTSPTDGSEIAKLRRLLAKQFGEDIHDFEPLAGGFFSRAYGFSTGHDAYVIRFHSDVHARESFEKDDYAWQHFASATLPIPEIVARGETPDWCYAISRRVEGRPVESSTPDVRRAILPQLLDTIETIGNVDVSTTSGYGGWDSIGSGEFASWRGFLASILDDHADGYYQNWHRFFDTSFLEREVYETVGRRMLALAERCPERRALVHNDFHFNNILTDGERITAVIDWANALYGDPLYDIAWLNWQAANPGWWYDDGAAILRARFGALPGYATRIACYLCHIGLDHLRFYTRTDNQVRYNETRDWLLGLLATSNDV
jgi:hygromycin-B 4-O-kinase